VGSYTKEIFGFSIIFKLRGAGMFWYRVLRRSEVVRGNFRLRTASDMESDENGKDQGSLMRG